MNKDDFRQELKQFEGQDNLTIVTDEDEYIIEDGESFLGGSPNTYMSELLGNVAYPSLESAGLAVYDYLVNELGETVVEVTI